MSTIRDRVEQRVVLGLKGGGQISLAALDAQIEDALDRVFEMTEMARVELTPIDEVEGENKYVIAPLAVESTGRICRLTNLYRAQYNDALEEVSRTEIAPEGYATGLLTDSVASLASITNTVALYSNSPKTLLNGLIPIAVVAFKLDAYVPPQYTRQAEDAIAAKVMETFSLETGKPWSDKNKASEELKNFNNSVAYIRNRVARAASGRNLTVRPTHTFV